VPAHWLSLSFKKETRPQRTPGLSLHGSEAKLYQKKKQDPKEHWGSVFTEAKPNYFKKETIPQRALGLILHGSEAKLFQKRSKTQRTQGSAFTEVKPNYYKKIRPQRTLGLILRERKAKLFLERNKTLKVQRLSHRQKWSNHKNPNKRVAPTCLKITELKQ
jgi:hypothetical protein